MARQHSTNQNFMARLFLGIGLAGFITAIATACSPEGGSDGVTSTPAAGDMQARTTSQVSEQSPTSRVRSVPTRPPTLPPARPERGRLGARPGVTAQADSTAQPGTHPLGITSGRDGLIYIPSGYKPDQPAPLVLLLHGAGGDARGGLSLLQAFADESNLILVAPDSRGRTWDFIIDRYGPDVSYIDKALAQTFSRYNVDATRLAVGGFSDGASYALSLGVTNGDLFTHIISFSPGFMAPGGLEGKPRIFNSHGIHDQVLSIDQCSRRVVPELQRLGYDVIYREFDGPHTVPHDIAREAVSWLLGDMR